MQQLGPKDLEISRRTFVQNVLLAGVGVPFWRPSLGLAAPASPAGLGFCVTLCNHWSYIGIGWQLGVESCVLSVTDAMELADRDCQIFS
jgi:hypothetical protein